MKTYITLCSLTVISFLIPLISQGGLFTVTNTNDAGAGSFRQAIIDVNASTAVRDTIRFNIPIADGGYNAGTGVFSINLSSGLPELRKSQVLIDGFSQTIFTGNTNAVTFRSQTTVGTGPDGIEGTVDDPVFPAINGAEIQLNYAGGVANKKITIVGDSNIVRGIAFRNVRLLLKGNTEGVIEQCTFGINAHSFASPGSAANRITNNATFIEGCITIYDSTINLTIRNNLIAYANQRGIFVIDANWNYNMLITENEIAFTNRQDNFSGGAMEFVPVLEPSAPDTTSLQYRVRKTIISKNLIHDMKSTTGNTEFGLEFANKEGTYNIPTTSGQTDSILIENNTIYETNGAFSMSKMDLPSTGNIIKNNIIRNNILRGISLNASLLTTLPFQAHITMNAMYNNAELGINLRPNNITTGPSAGPVNTNDNGDVDNGPNTNLNFPLILSSNYDLSGNLVLYGTSPAGATIEIFAADNNIAYSPLYPTSPNSIPAGYTSPLGINGFGEGRFFMYSFVEGDASDLVAGNRTYNDDGTGILGSRTEAAWRVVIPSANLPVGFNLNWRLTSTASLNGNTSEFGPSPILSILPEEKNSFSASKTGNMVALSFKSNQQLKNAIVQWSVNNNATWNNVTQLNNLQSENTYTAWHETPAQGNNFYRVKMTDENGQISYSQVQLVKWGFSFINSPLTVYPNPSSGNFSLNLPDDLINRDVSLQITGMNGSLVLAIDKLRLNQGQLMGANLAKGVYSLSLTSHQTGKKYQAIISIR